MVASYRERIQRLDRLASAIPTNGDGLDCRTLLERLGSTYGGASEAARLRAIQRDLDELVVQERAEITNPGRKPLRYRRSADVRDDAYAQGFALEQLRAAITDLVPAGDIDGAVRLIVDRHDALGLDSDRIRILTDSLRLVPAALAAGVLNTAVEGLVRSRVVLARYRDAAGKVTNPTLHPQAIVQRGPRLYLYALKNDEHEVRMYAMQRFTRASLGDEAARHVPDFDLEDAIRSGFADFSDGELLKIVLRARGYVADLLHDCALSEDQVIEDDALDGGFDVRVTATVPNSGKLLRWLLGCGDNVEVVEPASLRSVIAAQHRRASNLYERDG